VGADAVRAQVEELASNKDTLAVEKKAVMRDWLKLIFRAQVAVPPILDSWRVASQHPANCVSRKNHNECRLSTLGYH